MSKKWWIVELLVIYSILVPPTPNMVVECHWIDPDTPESARSTYAIPIVASDVSKPFSAPTVTNLNYHHNNNNNYNSTHYNNKYILVMSDEFNVPNRNFTDGSDPKWTALNKNDYTNDALHFYSHDNVQTNDKGELTITTKIQDTQVEGFDDVTLKNTRLNKHFTSGMLQSWNKFCYTGGILEAEVELPGSSDVGGLWPSLWILGNLARHTYVGSASHVWPFASTQCQTQTMESQLISGCMDSVHYGLHPKVGRGAPEVDIFEVQPGSTKSNTGPFLEMPVGQPFMSASYQVAPGRTTNRPGDGYWPGPDSWYKHLRFGLNTTLNILFYGTYNFFREDVAPEKQDYWSDAISFNRQLTEEHFTGRHVYRLEWEVPDEETGELGHLHWFLDDELVLAINGTSLQEAGTGGQISSEPSSIIINTAISSQWGFTSKCGGDCPCETFDCHSPKWGDRCGFSPGFCDMLEHSDDNNDDGNSSKTNTNGGPPTYKMNWVRVYQDPTKHKQKVGCSTPERPTKTFIEAFADRYKLESDDRPLKPIQRGRGECTTTTTTPMNEDDNNNFGPEQCGGTSRGHCTPTKMCACKEGWTGPHCLVPDGYDPIQWEVEERLQFHGPDRLNLCVTLILCLIMCVLVCVHTRNKPSRSKRRRVKAGIEYSPIS